MTERTKGASARATKPQPDATSSADSSGSGLARSSMGWAFSASSLAVLG